MFHLHPTTTLMQTSPTTDTSALSSALPCIQRPPRHPPDSVEDARQTGWLGSAPPTPTGLGRAGDSREAGRGQEITLCSHRGSFPRRRTSPCTVPVITARICASRCGPLTIETII